MPHSRPVHLLARQRARGRDAIRRVAAEAWEAFAPSHWLHERERVFFSRETGSKGQAVPASLMAVVCLCADVAGVEAAEPLARAIAAACGLGEDVRVAWEMRARPEISATGTPPWAGAPDSRFFWPPLTVSAGEWMERLPSSIRYNFTGWLVRSRGVVPAAAITPLVALHRLGYAVGGISGGYVVLRCPSLPVAYERNADGTRRQ